PPSIRYECWSVMARQYCGAGEPRAMLFATGATAAAEETPPMPASARLLVCLALAAAAPLARAQLAPDGMQVQPLATGLSAPTGFEFLPDGRVLFVEQFSGRVQLFREDVGVQANPVMTVAGVSAGGERGLLGVAVDPRFPGSPYLYLYYDLASPQSIRISPYTLSGDPAGTGGADLPAGPAPRPGRLTHH